MRIGKNWQVESDLMNVILSKRHIVKATDKKPKHEYWSTEGYFSSIKSALKALVDLEVAETGLKDLETVSQRQDELYKLIESLGGKYAKSRCKIN